MKVCENCEIDHDGSYGSGRFCSAKCARGFSTKSKRKQINEKVSKSLTGRPGWTGKLPGPKEKRYCKLCNNIFFTYPSQPKMYCSVKCVKSCPEHSKVLSTALKGKCGGPREGGGYGKHSDYFKPDGTKVHCQSTMEHAMCIILDNLGLDWDRNYKGFEYIDLNGKSRNYYPDFYLAEYDIYLETKGYLTTETIHKMSSANIEKLVIIKTNKFGGNWNEIQKDNKLLLNELTNFQ